MAFQVGSACYGTAQQAAEASASGQMGAVVQHGGSAYGISAFSVTGTSITYTLAPVGGGANLSLTTGYTAQPCNLLTYEDGLTIGWMVAAAWIAAYALSYLADVVRGWGGGDGYGNS